MLLWEACLQYIVFIIIIAGRLSRALTACLYT